MLYYKDMSPAGSPVSINSEEDNCSVTERIYSRRRGRMLADDRHVEVHHTSSSPGSVNLKKKLNVVKNDKFDEAIELSDDEDNSSMDSALMDEDVGSYEEGGGANTNMANNLNNDQYDEAYDISDDESEISSASMPPESDVEQEYKGSIRREVEVPLPLLESCANGGDDNVTEPDSIDELNLREGTSTTFHKVKGEYDPALYANLNVSDEVKGLFEYISGYIPQHIELESTLKCFMPDYIPAIGDVNPFLKVPRPDGKPDKLGFQLIDEPSAVYQSDPNVLELHLRSLSRKQHGELEVRSIENAHKRPKEIERWILSINELHRSKPPLQVYHNKPMPDFDSLMEVWPEEVENTLNKISVRK